MNGDRHQLIEDQLIYHIFLISKTMFLWLCCRKGKVNTILNRMSHLPFGYIYVLGSTYVGVYAIPFNS